MAVALGALLFVYLMTFGCSHTRAPALLSVEERVERILKSSPVIGKFSVWLLGLCADGSQIRMLIYRF